MSVPSLPSSGVLLGALAASLVALGCGSSDNSNEPSGAEAGASSTAGAAGAGQVASGGAVSGAAGTLFGTSGSSGSLSGAGGAANGISGASFGGSAGSSTTSASGSGGVASGGVTSTSGGTAGSAGLGGKAGGAGSGGKAGSAGSDGMVTNTDYLKARTNGYGYVNLTVSKKNQILSLATTLTVPDKPKANTGTLFLWPGLQPGGANYEPIDNGVLQPVLTWGPTCAPGAPNKPYASWWISGQYVNTYGSAPGYTDCHGGDGMTVAVGDALHMSMTLNGTVWNQTVTDAGTNHSVTYDLDMQGQTQNYAEFVIEQYTEDPAGDVIFTDTTIVLDKAEAAACQPTMRGAADFFSNPKASSDGKQCTIDRIVLRAQGVAATSPN